MKSNTVVKQTISKGGIVYCITYSPYDEDEIKQIKKAGYRVKEEFVDKSSCKNAFGEKN